MFKEKQKTAQELFNVHFLEKEEMSSNETLDLLQFMKASSTPLSQDQIKAMLLLTENGLGDLVSLVPVFREEVTPTEIYFKTIDKLTLADRIKGNAKLSHLMKSDGLANPAGSLKASDVQAQGMSRKEIDKY